MQKNLRLNYICELSYRILTILIPLITTPYISRVIGPAGIGDYSYTQSICAYFLTIAVLGTELYGQRQVAVFQDNLEQRSKLFWDLLIFRFITIAIAFVAYIWLIVIMPAQYKTLFIIQSMGILGLIFDITWFFRGMEEFPIIVIRNLIVKLLGILFIFLFVKTQADLNLYVFSITAASFLGNMSLFFSIHKYIKKPVWKKVEIKKHILPSVTLFFPQIALIAYNYFDKTMLGSITKSSVENGYYEQASKIIFVAITVIIAAGNVLAPRIAKLFGQNDTLKIHELLYKSFDITFFLSIPLCFGLIGTASNIVPWFFGDQFEKVILLLQLFSPIAIAMGMKNVIGVQFFIPTNRQNYYTLSIAFGTFINIFCNLLLIPKFASMGAIISSVISEYLLVGVALFLARKELNIHRIIQKSYKKIISSSVMLVISLLLSQSLSPTFVHSLFIIAFSALSYIIILLLLKDELLIDLMQFKIRKK
ncbi:flippase [Diplocloster agilis]|nr:flippase [Diplocloster agilis]